jgi:histone-lysine N-methyltransferase SETD1
MSSPHDPSVVVTASITKTVTNEKTIMNPNVPSHQGKNLHHVTMNGGSTMNHGSMKQQHHISSLSATTTTTKVVESTTLSTGSGTEQAQSSPKKVPPPSPPTSRISRISPFRIKTGCIVACRINHQLFSPHVSLQITTKRIRTTGSTSSTETIPSSPTTVPVPDDPTNNTTISSHRISPSTPFIPNGTSRTVQDSNPTSTNKSSIPHHNIDIGGTDPTDTTPTATTSTTEIVQYPKDRYHMVWTNPIQHRDLFWSLIGKRIRCSCDIPNGSNDNSNDTSTTTNTNHNIDHHTTTSTTTSMNAKKKAKKTTTTIFDGEVIRLYPSRVHTDHSSTNPWNVSSSSSSPEQLQDVELLIDATLLSKIPFLQQYVIATNRNRSNGASSKKDDIELPLSKKERRMMELEQHVARGICIAALPPTHHNPNTTSATTTINNVHDPPLVSIRITLQYPNYSIDTSCKEENNDCTLKTTLHPINHDDDATTTTMSQPAPPPRHVVVIRKWVVQKCIPISFGKQSRGMTNHPTHKKRKLMQPQFEEVQNNNNNHIVSSSLSSNHGEQSLKKLKDTNAFITTTTTTAAVAAKTGDSSHTTITPNQHNNDGHGKTIGETGIKHHNIQNGAGDALKYKQKHVTSDSTNQQKRKKVRTAAANSSSDDATFHHHRVKLSTQQYMGDGNDTADQQIHNWRFLASRYHDLLYKSFVPMSMPIHPNTKPSSIPNLAMVHYCADLLSGGFVGKVIKVDSNAAPSITLAMVTIRRMILPEHTFSGRCNSIHDWNDVFDDYDHTQSCVEVTITIPIEQLVVISRTALRPINTIDHIPAAHIDAIIRYSYSWAYHIYIPSSFGSEPSNHDNQSNSKNLVNDLIHCHKCRRTSKDSSTSTSMIICTSPDCRSSQEWNVNAEPSTGTTQVIAWCKGCIDTLNNASNNKAGIAVPCCENRCDCDICALNHMEESQLGLYNNTMQRTKEFCKKTQSNDNLPLATYDALSFSASILQSMEEVSLFLDNSVNFFSLSKPQQKHITGIKDRAVRVVKPFTTRPTAKSSNTANKSKPKEQKVIRGGEIVSFNKVLPTTTQKRPLLLKKNHCAREIVYNASKKYSFKSWIGQGPNMSLALMETPRSLRTIQDSKTRLITEQKDEVAKASSSSRAARASQRRFLKDVASLGITAPSYLGLVDTLANREPQLRFDRSLIHAWGVFADAAISAGEMIVEYRGELIGNAVAELREKEYEAAKIGSDYMFRIDSLNVCDATKQGNVARFINASCDPNCYTKIITFDGSKRIVIYAKKDIQVGEELCYDYKFPIEYDKTKRIRCHCGARECRGYMNWVSAVTCLLLSMRLIIDSHDVPFCTKDKKFVTARNDRDKELNNLTSENKPMKCASEMG